MYNSELKITLFLQTSISHIARKKKGSYFTPLYIKTVFNQKMQTVHIKELDLRCSGHGYSWVNYKPRCTEKALLMFFIFTEQR